MAEGSLLIARRKTERVTAARLTQINSDRVLPSSGPRGPCTVPLASGLVGGERRRCTRGPGPWEGDQTNASRRRHKA